MELRHLRYFVAVAEELNFTRAAERLRMSQPPLSLQIRQLEEDLQVELLRRSKQSVVLTEPGKAFLEYCYRILEMVGDARQRVASVSRGELGRLTIGFVGSTSRMILPRILQTYTAQRPDVQVMLTDMSPALQVEALESRRIHVGLSREPIHSTSITSLTLKREAMCLMMPTMHRFASAPVIAARELQKEPFIIHAPSKSLGVYDKTIRVCLALGFRPNVRYEINLFNSAIDLIAAGLGIAVLPQGLGESRSDDIVIRPIEGAEASEICICFRADSSSQIVKDFVASAMSCFDVNRPARSVVSGRVRTVRIATDGGVEDREAI